MSQLPPPQHSPHSTDASATPVVEPGFEVQVQAFWENYRNVILLAAVLVLVTIVGREGWHYYAAAQERDVEEAFAKVADKPDQLVAFADAHASHTLAGVAYLQVADQKFAAGNYAQAMTLYGKAAGSLKNEALLGRAKIGAAVSQINNGDKAAGQAALKAVGADASLLKGVRAEATYHLAALAYEAGRYDEVKTLVAEISKIDLASAWSQRATLLLTSLPAGAQAANPAAPGITFKPDGK